MFFFAAVVILIIIALAAVAPLTIQDQVAISRKRAEAKYDAAMRKQFREDA